MEEECGVSTSNTCSPLTRSPTLDDGAASASGDASNLPALPQKKFYRWEYILKDPYDRGYVLFEF